MVVRSDWLLDWAVAILVVSKAILPTYYLTPSNKPTYYGVA